MVTTVPRTVIVGSSIGGVRTAQGLRAAGYDGEIVLIGEESRLPYDKPPLSKGYLAGSRSESQLALCTQEELVASDIELRLGSPAEHLDAAAKTIMVRANGMLSYDRLVIATGARARPAPWNPRVHVLRTFQDAAGIAEALATAKSLVVIGAGFVGAEVAATARGLGVAVTLVDPAPAPLGRAIAPGLAQAVTELHRRNGVDCRLGVGVQEVLDFEDGLVVLTSAGEKLQADLVVAGIGAAPNVSWLEGSALRVDDGVVCDEYGRAAGATEVFAVGDVSRWRDPRSGSHRRFEHWTSAVGQAKCVAHNIANPLEQRAREPQEYVWTDQHDWRMQILGQTSAHRREVLIGHPHDGRFAALYSADDRTLCGAVVVNWPRAFMECQRTLDAGADLDSASTAIRQLPPPRR